MTGVMSSCIDLTRVRAADGGVTTRAWAASTAQASSTLARIMRRRGGLSRSTFAAGARAACPAGSRTSRRATTRAGRDRAGAVTT